MALGITVDINANIARFSNQIDRLSGDLNRFQARAESTSSRINKAFSAIGVGLSVAGVTAFVKSGIDAADALNDMSLKTGIAVENLSGFQLATKQSGTDMEAFVSAANKLSVNIAKDGEAFKKLGIDARDPAEAFLQLADVFASIDDPQKRAALGAKALGKSWQEMAPLLYQGGEALRAAVKEGTELNGITAEMAKNADEFNDRLEIMNRYLGNAAANIAGPFVEGFNQLSAKIQAATKDAVTFNNVMLGIGDFAFQNLTDIPERIGSVIPELDALNEKIVAAKDKLKYEQASKQNLDNEIVAQNELNALLDQRSSIIAKFQDVKVTKDSDRKPLSISRQTVDDFIGSQESAQKAQKIRTENLTTAGKLNDKYQEMIASMERENALRGENSAIVKLQYDIQHGAFSEATRDQQIRLQQLAYESDAMDRQEKQWAALIEDANDYYDLKKSTDDLIRSGNVQSGFNEQLAKIQDSGINPEQMKVEFDKLGQAYNEEFIDPAISETNKLSLFADQAARNMQSSFADFLFDPFANGMTGMLDGFITTLRKMAAEATSAMIFDSLKSTQSGGGGGADKAVGWLAQLFGASGGLSGSGSIASSDAAFLASANGNVFARGSMVPFADGGVFNSPATFPMSGGKTGLLGEAGPEAIMPLSRGPDGKLGIKTRGSQGHTIIVNVNGGSAPDIRRAAGQGAREALGMLNGASRYG